MGNYFASLPYINHGYQPENNNRVDTTVDVQLKEPKVVPRISNYVNVVDFSSVLAMNRLQNECENDSSIMMKIRNRLNNLHTSPFTTGTRNISEENNQIASVTPSCETSCKEMCEAKREDCISFRLNFKQSQRSRKDLCKRSQHRPLANSLFQRTDSGFEDTPYPYTTQVDLDSFHLTTMIRTADIQSSLIKRDLECRMNATDGYHKSVSFFIDIRDPLKQKPLCEEYRFSACNECDSLFSEDECSEESFSDDCLHDDDSLFSEDECSEESFSDDCLDDDDFVVFEDHDEEDSYGFNFTLNTCTPAKLSCSISANYTVKTCFDMSVNTTSISSVNASFKTNPRTLNKEPTVPVQIGIPSANNDSKTQHESTIYRKSNTSKVDRCAILRSTGCISTSEVTPGSCTNQKKSRKKVCFEKDEDLVVVYQMRHWDFAYRNARKGPWELAAVDRCRFWQRIKELEAILTPCLRQKLESIQKSII